MKRIVLITGSGRGIGAASAELFAANGYSVVINSRSSRELNAVAARIAKRNGKDSVLSVAGDVSDEKFVQTLFAKARKKFGSVHILINNAAMLALEEFSSLTTKTWDETMGVNLRGPFLCSREFFRQFQKIDRKSTRLILNISSLGGIPNTAKFIGLSAYTVSKFGIYGLTECLAEEGKPLGIDVIAIAPGAVDTTMLRRAAPHLKPSVGPKDIAQVLFTLASSSCTNALNGAVIPLNTNA